MIGSLGSENRKKTSQKGQRKGGSTEGKCACDFLENQLSVHFSGGAAKFVQSLLLANNFAVHIFVFAVTKKKMSILVSVRI